MSQDRIPTEPPYEHPQPVNITVNPDTSTAGEFYEFIYGAESSLSGLVETGFWTPEQAQEYAHGYSTCMNAFDVMRRNTLLRQIRDDTPLDYAPPFPHAASENIYDRIDSLADFATLSNLRYGSDELSDRSREVTDALASMFPKDAGVAVGLESPFRGFWHLRLSRVINGESYTFYLNIDTQPKPDEEKVAVLSYLPATEVIYGFRDLAASVPLIAEVLAAHSRLNIVLPNNVEEAIAGRRRSEKAYQAELIRLSQTDVIQPAQREFTDGYYVAQTAMKVRRASEGPIGTTGVGPCVVVGARGKTHDGELIIGEVHIDA